MPRSSNSIKTRGSLFPSKPRTQTQTRSHSTLPAKRPSTSNQPQIQSQPTIQKGPGIGDSIKQGFGLGVGLEGARAAVGAVGGLFSSGSESSPQQGEQLPQSGQQTNQMCSFEKSVYQKCLDEQNNSLANCQDFFRMWEKCQINSQESIDEILD